MFEQGPHNCGPACTSCDAAQLVRLGIKPGNFDFVVALAGNPNTGKSTIFNNLTGLRQHTGNWPGKTVNRSEGGFGYSGKKFKLIDLPGTYSLLSNSEDEEIARDFILLGKPDVTVITADATQLERNLNLALQILELTGKAIFCLNLVDEAERKGIKINYIKLEGKLGIPVVPAVASSKKGMPELIRKIFDVANSGKNNRAYNFDYSSGKLAGPLEKTISLLNDNYPGLENARWYAMRLLEGDMKILDNLDGNRQARR